MHIHKKYFKHELPFFVINRSSQNNGFSLKQHKELATDTFFKL